MRRGPRNLRARASASSLAARPPARVASESLEPYHVVVLATAPNRFAESAWYPGNACAVPSPRPGPRCRSSPRRCPTPPAAEVDDGGGPSFVHVLARRVGSSRRSVYLRETAALISLLSLSFVSQCPSEADHPMDGANRAAATVHRHGDRGLRASVTSCASCAWDWLNRW